MRTWTQDKDDTGVMTDRVGEIAEALARALKLPTGLDALAVVRTVGHPQRIAAPALLKAIADQRRKATTTQEDTPQ